jgi:DnaJ-class molecular chaperone
MFHRKRKIRTIKQLNREAALARLPKLCQSCGGSRNDFYMKEGKPRWRTCSNCNGRGVA